MVLRLDVAPFTGIDAGLAALQADFTGTPALADVAWGPSAPTDGQYAHVSPSVTAITQTRNGDVDVVTSLVTWIGTKAGQAWDAEAAASSESAAAESALENAVCVGKEPCPVGGATSARPDMMFWIWTLAVLWGGMILCWL